MSRDRPGVLLLVVLMNLAFAFVVLSFLSLSRAYTTCGVDLCIRYWEPLVAVIGNDFESLPAVENAIDQISTDKLHFGVPYSILDKAKTPEVINYLLDNVVDIFPSQKFMSCVNIIWAILNREDISDVVPGSANYNLIASALNKTIEIESRFKSVGPIESQMQRLALEGNVELFNEFYKVGFVLKDTSFITNFNKKLHIRAKEFLPFFLNSTDGLSKFGLTVVHILMQGELDTESLELYMEHGLPISNPPPGYFSWLVLALQQGDYQLAKFFNKRGLRLKANLSNPVYTTDWKLSPQNFRHNLAIEHLVGDYAPLALWITDDGSDLGVFPKDLVQGHVMPYIIELAYPSMLEKLKEVVFEPKSIIL